MLEIIGLIVAAGVLFAYGAWAMRWGKRKMARHAQEMRQ